MSYLTIKDNVSVEFDEKKSTFIGHIKRVYNENEAKEFVNEIKNQNKQAAHNVYAYIVGENLGIQRYSDDGEPQGTAGIPVLEVIKKNGITDVAVVVTRYFGGILLGASGLVRAYTRGCSDAIKAGNIVLKVKGIKLAINLDYDLLGKVQYVFAQNLWHIEETEYTDKVCISFICESTEIENVKNQITQCTSGKATFQYGEEEYYFKMENRLFFFV